VALAGVPGVVFVTLFVTVYVISVAVPVITIFPVTLEPVEIENAPVLELYE
jgi:hypothetical protein